MVWTPCRWARLERELWFAEDTDDLLDELALTDVSEIVR